VPQNPFAETWMRQNLVKTDFGKTRILWRLTAMVRAEKPPFGYVAANEILAPARCSLEMVTDAGWIAGI
jgi:hypothetical protein